MFPYFPPGLAIPCFILLGAVFIMLVYHFLLYLQYRDGIIFKYCLYLLAIGLYLLADMNNRIHYSPGAYTGNALLSDTFNFLAILAYAAFIIETIPVSRERYRKLFFTWNLVSGATILYVLFCFALYVRGPRGFEGFIDLMNSFFRILFVFVGVVAATVFFTMMNSRFLQWIKWGAISYLFFMAIVLYVMFIPPHRSLFGLSPMHYVYLGTIADVIIFSVAMSLKIKELVARVNEIRNRLSRDLHDDIGATLSSIHVYSSVAAKAMDQEPVKAKDALKQINENARRVMDTMSDMVWAMKSTETGETSLEGRLKNYGYELLTPLGINCVYGISHAAEVKITNLEARKNILLIIKEAMNNIAKYSQAMNAGVFLTMEGHFILLGIQDDGKGFNTATARPGNGLQHMQQRTKQLGGSFHMESGANQGTKISCRIPLTTISDS